MRVSNLVWGLCAILFSFWIFGVSFLFATILFSEENPLWDNSVNFVFNIAGISLRILMILVPFIIGIWAIKFGIDCLRKK